MSENGPWEGTRDLPRPGPDAGRRSVEEDSPAGVAYGTLSRSLRRRRAELVALLDAGGTTSNVANSYQVDHPLEPAVTPEEIVAAVVEAKLNATQKAARIEREGRSRDPKRPSRG